MINKKEIEQALQQFSAYRAVSNYIGDKDFALRSLTTSMGLKDYEWDYIKDKEDSANLNEDEIKFVDDVFCVEGEKNE